jgi:hypothetical protein
MNMKKSLLLTLALGAASAANLKAVDVYITGSTAFRANVYTACQKLFVGGAPAVYYGTNITGGGNGKLNSSDTAWCMTGTPISAITNISGTLNIHALFTGSIQGIQAVESYQVLTFPGATGANGGLCTSVVNAAPTIGFSDSASLATPAYDVAKAANMEQEDVAVQPFVMCKSMSSNTKMTNILNVSWDEMQYAIENGNIPLSAWSGKAADASTMIYVLERTADSGTRRVFTAEHNYPFGKAVTVYIYDRTNTTFWLAHSAPIANGSSAVGTSGIDTVSSAGSGLNGANLNWGSGYVGGGDIKTALGYTDSQNLSIACLSIADAKGIGAVNWSQVVPFNGMWPTAAGAGISGNSATNDFSPITSGYYPLWGTEVLVHMIDPSQAPNGSNQNITGDQLGDNQTPGSFLGVFNAQTIINGGTPMVGSIENEIELSKTGGATAIRLSDMVNKRASVGGKITPN